MYTSFDNCYFSWYRVFVRSFQTIQVKIPVRYGSFSITDLSPPMCNLRKWSRSGAFFSVEACRETFPTTELARNLAHAHSWLSETLGKRLSHKGQYIFFLLKFGLCWKDSSLKSHSVSYAHAPDSVLAQWEKSCTEKKAWDLDHFPITRILDIGDIYNDDDTQCGIYRYIGLMPFLCFFLWCKLEK